MPISSELGNISPWLVTPGGAWTERQLSHHAKVPAAHLVGDTAVRALRVICERGCLSGACCGEQAPRPHVPVPPPAQALTEALLDNCSCNCLAAKLVVLSDEWEHADAFVAK